MHPLLSSDYGHTMTSRFKFLSPLCHEGQALNYALLKRNTYLFACFFFLSDYFIVAAGKAAMAEVKMLFDLQWGYGDRVIW